MRVQTNGIELEAEVFGDDDGEPLVLVMGIGAQMLLWPESFCEALAAEGYRVVRFDNRDVGLSTKMDHLGTPDVFRAIGMWAAGLPVNAPYDLTDMADDVFGLMDALGMETAHVVGCSMGGMIAQVMAVAHPQRLRTLTSVMSTTGSRWVSFGSPKAIKALLSKPPKTAEQAVAKQRELMAVIGGSGFAVDEEAAADRAVRCFERGAYPRGFARQMTAILKTGDRTPALRFVRVPTLVVHGDEDSLVPLRGGVATARAIPGARLRVVHGMGHNLPEGLHPLLVDAIVGHARQTERLRARAPVRPSA